MLLAFWYKSSLRLGMAPDAIFTTLTGNKIDLKQLQGNPVIVTFWATNCATCIQEIPHLIKLYQQFHPQGLEIIAVAMYYDPPNHVLSMSKAKQIPYPVALDLTANHAKAFGKICLKIILRSLAPDASEATTKSCDLSLKNSPLIRRAIPVQLVTMSLLFLENGLFVIFQMLI
jgi:thiol-disulfide isomerase/thioredoxin